MNRWHLDKISMRFRSKDVYKRQAFRIIGAHVDSPRLDVKQVPLYEESNQVYLDTHYYGGIKKYQ